MSLEDAYVLSNLLSRCVTTDDLLMAFDAYDFVRVPRALRVTAMSREQGKAMDMEGEFAGDNLEKLAEEFDMRVRWIWNEDLEAHLAKAVERFEDIRGV